jgi:hypothetical protein
MSSNPLVWRESHRRCGFGHFRADSNRKRTPGSEIGPSHILDLTNFGSTFCKVMGPGVACPQLSEKVAGKFARSRLGHIIHKELLRQHVGRTAIRI